MDVIDILLVAFIIYKTLMLIRGPRAWRIILGAMVFVILLAVSNRLKLGTLHWLLDRAAVLLPVAIVILLMPEFGKLLEGIMRSTRIPGFAAEEDTTEVRTIEE